MTERISRRKLLGGVVAALLVPIHFRRLASLAADPWSTLRSALFKVCGSQTVPWTLGRACIMQGLLPVIMRKQDLAASYERATVARVDFAAWFEMECLSDFEAGRVVRVDRWVISETEFLLFSNCADSA